YKQTMLMMKINLASCLVNVAMNVILLPRIGLLGAALATLGSYVVMTGLFAYYAQEHLPLSLDWLAWLKYSGVAVLSWFLVSRLEINNFVLSLLVRGSLSLLCYFGTLYLMDSRTRELAGIAVRAASRALGLERAHSEGSAA